jgi:hypothetical protein
MYSSLILVNDYCYFSAMAKVILKVHYTQQLFLNCKLILTRNKFVYHFRKNFGKPLNNNRRPKMIAASQKNPAFV